MWANGLQQAHHGHGVCDANQLLVERDVYGRTTADVSHLNPLPLLDGLLARVDGIFSQGIKALQGVVGRETAVGIHAYGERVGGKSLANVAHQLQFAVEVDGADFQFYGSESGFDFLLYSAQHLMLGAHPHQSVDGNVLLALNKG